MSESLSTPTLPPAVRGHWRRWLIRVVLGVVLAVGLAYAYSLYTGEKDLREAIAEADHLDPGWQFEDLEAQRAQVPDAENAARCVVRVHQLMPQLGADEELQRRLADVEPQQQLTEPLVALYALGPDRRDDGGTLDRANPNAEGSDLGVRLWDVARRRQPPFLGIRDPARRPER